MNVYIEYAVLDNLIIDGLLLYLACKTLKISARWWRILLGAAVGTACALLSVFVSGFYLYAVKAVTLFLMCVITVGFGKKLFWHILLTLAYTFLLGGAIVGLFELFCVDYVTDGGTFYELNVPLFVYVLAVFLVGFLCYSVAVYFRNLKKIAPYLVKISVTLDKEYQASAFLDSGNTLTFNGLPVCFVTKQFGNFASYYAEQAVRGKVSKIDVSTMAGETSVSAVLCKITLNGTEKQAYLALPQSKSATPYNVLLGCDFMSDIR